MRNGDFAPSRRGDILAMSHGLWHPTGEGVAMTGTSIKEEARRLIEALPEEATWEDLQHRIYIRQRIEEGLRDSREGRTVPLEEARRQSGLPPR